MHKLTGYTGFSSSLVFIMNRCVNTGFCHRYESTVVGQFFGHTHRDHYQMFYDVADLKRPLGVAYIVGSVTTYPDLNPGYRIYEIDGNYSDSTWVCIECEIEH